VWEKIGTGELNGQKALFDGLYRFEGDLNTLSRLGPMFSPAADKQAEPKKTLRQILRLPSVLRMTLSFAPLIVHWISGSQILYLPAFFISLGIFLYQLIIDKPVLLEIGHLVYFALMSALRSLVPDFTAASGLVLDYTYLAAIWLASCAGKHSVTADFMKSSYSEETVESGSFTATNRIITLVWGLYFIVCLAGAELVQFFPGTEVIRLIASNAAMLPLFGFTGWFAGYYPKRMLAKTNM